ncbi:MAG: hypothetical protein J6U20_10430 [Fibrobacter sp.]|nr:hypothetical protein [Fibrobacter sp.]
MNYSKIAKQMVCKTAVLLALTLVACFEDSRSIADGGTAEERGLQANNEVPCDTACNTKANNFSISGRAMRTEVPSPESTIPNSYEATSTMQGSFVPYGSVLRLSELDSVTLDTTGVFYYTRCTDTTGQFSFDSVSLNSPYVLIELLPYTYNDDEWELNKNGKLKDFSDSLLYYGIDFSRDPINNNYSAIVDLRTTNDIGLNIMTRLEASRIKHLVKNGTDFATAKQQADKEVLEALGIYNATFEFDKSDFAQDTNNFFIALTVYHSLFSSTSIYSIAPDYTARAVNAFGEAGLFTADDSVKAALLMRLKRWITFDSEYASNNENTFMIGYFAATIGLGECTAAREGDTVVTEGNQDQYLNLVCRSGAWVAEPGRYKILERVSFETGTMTDDRDGKTYKTVTYDIEGTPYTWIAENLTYSSDSIQPEIGIDSSVYRAFYGSGFSNESDFIKFKNSLDSTYWNNFARYAEQEVIGADTIVMESDHFQGICPSGYHIPTHREWSRLLYFTEYASGYCPDYPGCQEFKENDGFGWYASRYLPQIGFGEITLEAFAILEQGDDGTWSTQALMMANWKPNLLPTKQIPKFLSVRCVMD